MALAQPSTSPSAVTCNPAGTTTHCEFGNCLATICPSAGVTMVSSAPVCCAAVTSALAIDCAWVASIAAPLA